MGKRFRWILAGLIVGLLVGGAAYAGYNVAVVNSSPSDRWYACVGSTGVVRADTLRLNIYPASCPKSTDKIRTWNAAGPSGPSGTVGATGSTGVTGADGATGAIGPTAAHPSVRVIRLAQSYTNVASQVSFGPVDASDCRRISIHVTMTVPQSMLIRAYTGRSTSDSGFGLMYAGYGSLGASGVVVFPPAQPMGAVMFTVDPGGYLSMPAAYIMCETLPQPNRVIELDGQYSSVGAGGTVSFSSADVSTCSDVAFFAETPGNTSGTGRLYSALPPPEPIVGSVVSGSAEGIGGVVGYFPDPYPAMSNSHFTLTVGATSSVTRAWLLCTPF